MEDEVKQFIDLSQSLRDLAMKDTVELDEIIAENNGDIDLNVEYPYLVFQRSDLIRAMNLCNKIVQPKSDVITYNSISFIPVISQKSIYFYATNELSHFRFKTELLGDENEMLDMNLSISINTLQKIVKLMGNKVLIYKKEDNIYVRLLDGDLLLDLRQPNMKILEFPGNIGHKVSEISNESIGTVVNAILPLLNAEVKGEARRIAFTGEKAYYNSSFYYIEALINSPIMSLTYRDAEFISKLYKYYKDRAIQVWSVDSNLSRLFFKMDNIDYQFINSNASVSILMTQQMSKVVAPIEAMVNYDRLFRIITLATTLPTSTGNVNLLFNEDKLQASIVSNKGSSDFSFNTEKISDKLYKKTVLVKAETLRRLLSSFGVADKIGIALADLGITLEYKGIKAIMMHLE